jgi:hypothetical protein
MDGVKVAYRQKQTFPFGDRVEDLKYARYLWIFVIC